MKKNTIMTNLLSKMNRNFILMMSLFLSLTLITSCGGDDPDPEPNKSNPVASFTSQVDGANSLTYTFSNGSVVNGITDNTFTSSWDFGGDGTSNDFEPVYTFSGEGSYDVKLTITATDGEQSETTETIVVTAPKNRYASIIDTEGDATGGSDTGELRISMDSVQTGRLTFMWRVEEGPDMNIQDGFVNVSGSSTTGDFAIVEVRIKDNAPHEWREGASDATIAASTFPEGMPDVWVPMEISWAADGVNTPTFTVIMDGQTIIADAVSTTNGGAGDEPGHLAATMNGAHNIQFKYADNGKTSDSMFHIDDIVVYSSDSGTEVVVWEDDFQDKSAGDLLDPDLNADSEYHSNTMDASVREDQ